jgi:hypothetical protein
MKTLCPPPTHFCALRSGFPSKCANHRSIHEVNIEEEENGYVVFKHNIIGSAGKRGGGVKGSQVVRFYRLDFHDFYTIKPF